MRKSQRSSSFCMRQVVNILVDLCLGIRSLLKKTQFAKRAKRNKTKKKKRLQFLNKILYSFLVNLFILLGGLKSLVSLFFISFFFYNAQGSEYTFADVARLPFAIPKYASGFSFSIPMKLSSIADVSNKINGIFDTHPNPLKFYCSRILWL